MQPRVTAQSSTDKAPLMLFPSGAVPKQHLNRVREAQQEGGGLIPLCVTCCGGLALLHQFPFRGARHAGIYSALSRVAEWPALQRMVLSVRVASF